MNAATIDDDPRPTGAELAATLERLHAEWHRLNTESHVIYERVTVDRAALADLAEQRSVIEGELMKLVRPAAVIVDYVARRP
jgi:hypothetical protein